MLDLNTTQIEQEVSTELSKPTIAVVSQESYMLANDVIARFQGVKKNIQEFFAEPKKKASEAHKAICAMEKKMLAPVEAKIAELKDETTRWYAAEQERIRAEEERRRKDAEELARLAAEAEQTGDTDMAQEAVLAATLAESSVTVMPKVQGTSMREAWRAVVTDITQVPREYLVVNQSALDALARATKGAVNLPGVKFEKYYVNSTKAR